jgi:uncharacterized membrane protein
MKEVFSVALVIGGILLGLYVGVWVCFVGGIASLIEMIKSPENTSGLAVAIGLAKIFFSTLWGIISGAIPVFMGVSLLNK